MPSSDCRASRPPDEILHIPSNEPSKPQSRPQPPQLWIELLPEGVQYRIAEYVCQAVSGRDALNLAKTTPQQRHAVSVALDHFLINCFATHAEQLVEDWLAVIEDVHVLQLWEHPPNFQLLSSPHLAEVALEDEPKQLEALTESGVSLRRIGFYARYSTPTHIIIRMFEQVTFSELNFDDVKGEFFKTADVVQFANACQGLEKLDLSTTEASQDAVAQFIDRLPSLRTLRVVIEGVEISFDGHVPSKGRTPTVTGLGLYINKVKWFESLELQPQLKELWLMSDQGWGENEVLQFSCVILDLPQLADLTVKLRPGAERFFPKVSSLECFHAYWDVDVDLSDSEELYYNPERGVVTRVIEGMPLLTNLKLFAVRLVDEEVVQIVKNVGDTIKVFSVSIDRQGVPVMERLSTIIQALAHYAKCLETFTPCQRNEHGVPIDDPCEAPITSQRRQEILLQLDRVHRSSPQVHLGHVETSILDWPEEQSGRADNVKEETLQNAFSLRRCRRGMNETGGPTHMWTLAKLLETGCDGLAQDRSTALQLYKQAVRMEDPGDAILNFWRLTEDPDDLSTEPKPGGAFEAVLELDKTRVRTLPDSAELFVMGTRSTDPNPAAAAKLFQVAIDRGFTDTCTLILGNLVRAGYNNAPPDPYRAFDLYQLAINEHNDADAMFKVAEMLKHGYGREPPDPTAARSYLERGVRLGWLPCINDLALLLKEGYDDVPPDIETAVDLYCRAVAGGNTVAMNNLATLYMENCFDNLEVVQKAIALYEQSISEGQNANAMLLLGTIHEWGYCDAPPNPVRARELYVQAIEWGDCLGYTYLGNLAAQGYDDVPPDSHEAIRMYQLGIDTADGQPRICALWAYAGLTVRGAADLEPDPAKAVELYKRAVDQGDLGALCLLGEIYEVGGPGFEVNPAEAYRLYSRAIEEGEDPDAMRKLGDLIERGYGDVKPDPYKAVELYWDAISGGDMSACGFLGCTLERGYGSELPNPKEAANIFRMGAEEGDPECMCALGSILEKGFPGVSPDPLGAIDLYKRAIAEHGSTRAMRYLGQMLEEGFLANSPDCRAAVALYEMSATDPFSTIQLAELLETGYDDVAPDFERARNLYKALIDDYKSCPRSRSIAMRHLGQLIESLCGDDPVQLAEAADWYRKSIDTFEASCSLCDLASLLVTGYGDVEPDVPQAVSLLRRSIELYQCSQSFFLLADCVEQGYGDVEPDPEEATRFKEEGCLMLLRRMRI